MTLYRITLSGPPMDFPGFGRARTGWAATVEAEGEQAAVALAREKCRTDFNADYATGRATVERVWTFAITLRGKDKRRRETFVVRSTDEYEAVRALNHLSAAYRFTRRTLRKPDDPSVVKIERR